VAYGVTGIKKLSKTDLKKDDNKSIKDSGKKLIMQKEVDKSGDDSGKKLVVHV
jgi:hypothetical protein